MSRKSIFSAAAKRDVLPTSDSLNSYMTSIEQQLAGDQLSEQELQKIVASSINFLRTDGIVKEDGKWRPNPSNNEIFAALQVQKEKQGEKSLSAEETDVLIKNLYKGVKETDRMMSRDGATGMGAMSVNALFQKNILQNATELTVRAMDRLEEIENAKPSLVRRVLSHLQRSI